MTAAIAIGCSHTAGVGIEQHESWPSQLSYMIHRPVDNLAKGGANHSYVLSCLVKHLQNNKPEFAILQWPNPLRMTVWHNSNERFENINSASSAFKELLRLSPDNFYQPWLASIKTADLLCRLAQVPVVHILLENLEPEYLIQLEEIELHCDEKLPGRSWIFDSAARDGSHHSGRCHQQWAERIRDILDELTTR